MVVGILMYQQLCSVVNNYIIVVKRNVVPSHTAAVWLIRILATRQAQTVRYHSKWSHVANYTTVT